MLGRFSDDEIADVIFPLAFSLLLMQGLGFKSEKNLLELVARSSSM